MLSGSTGKVKFNADGSADVELKESDAAWRIFWTWGKEDVPLQDKHFVAHVDPTGMSGHIAPRSLAD